MSIELQKHRITVNALAPIAKTRMTEDLPMFQGVDTMTAPITSLPAKRCSSAATFAATAPVTSWPSRGARLYAFKVVETVGRFKDEDRGVWSAKEIAENWDAIVK